jgi:hypothetical protein
VDLLAGDIVHLPNGEARVRQVETSFKNTAVVEVSFEDIEQVAYVFMGAGNSTLPLAVYGSCAVPIVKILKFKRHDKFADLFFGSDDLAPCRATLETAGLSMDLSKMNLGLRKLVVSDPELARQTVDALRLRQIQGKPDLRIYDVVVSADWEEAVLFRVLSSNPYQKVKDTELVDLRFLFRGRKRQRLHSHQSGENVRSVHWWSEWVPAPRSDITCAATTTDANRPSLSRAITRARGTDLGQF